MDNKSTSYQARPNFKKRKYNTISGTRGYQNLKIAKIAKTVAQNVVNKGKEQKRKIYQWNSVGIDPVGGSAVTLGSVSYGSSTIIAQLGRGISQGTTDDDRIGLEIFVKKIRVNLAFQNADTSNYIRFALIKNKGRYTSTSTASLAQSIFSGEASSGYQWCSDIDTDYYKVYMDEKMWLRTSDAYGSAVVDSNIISKTIKFPGNGVRLQWDTQNISPAEDFLIVASSDSSALSHPGCVAGTITLYYTDS